MGGLFPTLVYTSFTILCQINGDNNDDNNNDNNDDDGDDHDDDLESVGNADGERS